jgi:hypothetical protein
MQYSLKSDRSGFSTIEKTIWSDRALRYHIYNTILGNTKKITQFCGMGILPVLDSNSHFKVS